MKYEPTKTVAEIAIEMPQSIPMFEGKGIDYCCGGQKSLREACAKAGADVNEVVRALETMGPQRESGESTASWNRLGPLIQHLLDKHHAFTRSQLALCSKLGSKVMMVHGLKRPELTEIMGLFNPMAAELEEHLLKEEQVAFPFLLALEKPIGVPPFPFEVFKNGPERVLKADHETVGEQLRRLRALTKDYAPPEGACVTFQAFYKSLKDLEEDLHLHIHLENNVLFPLAEKAVKQVAV